MCIKKKFKIDSKESRQYLLTSSQQWSRLFKNKFLSMSMVYQWFISYISYNRCQLLISSMTSSNQDHPCLPPASKPPIPPRNLFFFFDSFCICFYKTLLGIVRNPEMSFDSGLSRELLGIWPLACILNYGSYPNFFDLLSHRCGNIKLLLCLGLWRVHAVYFFSCSLAQNF